MRRFYDADAESPADAHARLIRLDREYGTHPMSPLHHDNRYCPLCDGR